MLDPVSTSLLVYLARQGGTRSYVPMDLRAISKALGVPQKNLEEKLEILKEEDYISLKSALNRGDKYGQISVSFKGKGELVSLMLDIQRSLDLLPKYLVLRGFIFSGTGEGKYYMSLEGYRSQFRRKLMFDPYPGTLNIKLLPQHVAKSILLEKLQGINIEGFTLNSSSFGPVKCFRALIKGEVEGAVLKVKRTKHPVDVLEVISPYYLREKLGLEDGLIVTIKVFI